MLNIKYIRQFAYILAQSSKTTVPKTFKKFVKIFQIIINLKNKIKLKIMSNCFFFLFFLMVAHTNSRKN